MPDRDHADLRPARESSSLGIVIIVVLLALAGGAYWWYTQQTGPEAPASTPMASEPQPDAPPPVAEAPPAPVATGPQYPVETPAAAPLPALNDADAQVNSALTELLGSKSVASFLQIDGFVRRVVATTDNLTREHAASRVWPVQPTPTRFVVSGSGAEQSIGADNAARYTPFVLFVEAINLQRAAALYARFYPLFQQAYEELGYPGRYFNDRLVVVLDHLLEAPEPAGPVQVKLTEIKSDVPGQRPWVRYEFADPRLESLSAGQKMMVRVGLVNERRLKARLKEFRGDIAGGPLAKK